jgi:hypothetical protein
MAAAESALSVAVRQLRRFGELDELTLSSLQRGTWEESDFSTALFALNRYPNEPLANITLRKIEQQENIIGFSVFPQLLRFAINNHRRVSPNVVARWGSHLATSANFSLLNQLLQRAGHSGLPTSMLEILNERLATSPENITSTEIANLMVNLTRSRFQFSEKCFEGLLISASKLWFPSRELGLLVYSMLKMSISPLTATRYLGTFSGQIESKFLTMTAQDRARFLCAYATIWSDISPKIIKAVMRDADLSLLEDSEVANILTALARYPIRGDDAVFQAVEELLIENLHISPFILSSITHSFIRRKQGSKEFKDLLLKKTLDEKIKHPISLFLFWNSAETGSDQRDLLEVELNKSLNSAGAVARSVTQLRDAGDEEAATALQQIASEWGYKASNPTA